MKGSSSATVAEGSPPEQRLEQKEAEMGAERALAAETEAQLRHELAEMAQKEAEMAQRLEQREAEIAALREELAQCRAATQPPPGAPAADLPASSTSSSEAGIQMVDGVAPPPDYQAGALRNAAMDGDIATVDKWLGVGIDPNAGHELLAGWMPLHYAAQLGHAAIISSLLNHGAHAQPLDRFAETPLMQAGYWGCTEAEAVLVGRGGGETRPALVYGGDGTVSCAQWKKCPAGHTLSPYTTPPGNSSFCDVCRASQGDGVTMQSCEPCDFDLCSACADARVGRWDQAGYVTILCSAPEWSLSGDNVMKALEGLCDLHHQQVKFGYDWGGSSTAEPSDANSNRQVRSCCHSLACTCTLKGEVVSWNVTVCCGQAFAECTCSDDRYGKGQLVLGSVNWRDAMSVAGSMWFPKYRTKVMGFIQAEAQRGVKFIELAAIRGGPVTQLEHRTMPMIVYGAVMDLKKKGLSISLLGDAEDTDIKVFLRTAEYDEFLSRFYEKVTLSASGMCLAAAAKQTQEDVSRLSVAAVLELGMPEEDTLAMLKKFHYDASLPLSNGGLLIVANAGKTQYELLASGEAALAALGLGAEEVEVVAKAVEAERALVATTVWTAHHAGITLAEGLGLATRTSGGGYRIGGGGDGFKSAVCGESLMAEGRHYAEFAVVKKTSNNMFVGVVPAAAAGEVTGMTRGWWREPAVHMCQSFNGKHVQGGRYSVWEGRAGFEQGDVVGMLLDFERGTLTVYKNGARLPGEMVPNAEVKQLGAGPFCWAVDMMGAGDAVRVARGAPPTSATEEVAAAAAQAVAAEAVAADTAGRAETGPGPSRWARSRCCGAPPPA